MPATISSLTTQNSKPIPCGKPVAFCRSLGTTSDDCVGLEPEIRCASGTVRLMRPHSISYHCKIGAAFPQERWGHKPMRDGNTTSTTTHSRAVYTPPSCRCQDDVEGLISKILDLNY